MKKKKNKKSLRDHIKHKDFEELSISSLEDHHRHEHELIPPLARLNTQGISWKDTGLNEVLWAAILRGNLEQKDCLDLFRKIILHSKNNLPKCEETFITHSALSAITAEQFAIWAQPILEHSQAKELLSALLLFDCLPDKSHWEKHLVTPEPNTHFIYLMKGVNSCLDHQSQEATDVRWLKVLYAIFVEDKIKFSEKFQERIEEIRLYPNLGDQRKVRPSIRSMELMLRASENGIPTEIPNALKDKIPAPWHEKFWSECLKKTRCVPGEREVSLEEKNYSEQFFNLYEKLCEHFMYTLEDTGINARRDACFGIVLYSLILSIGVSRGNIDTRAEGRILLRTISENYIILKYLQHKDNPTIWQQFRNYGTGQSKLAFLKNLREESVPSFIKLEDLHRYANEDVWQEHVSIKLKSWAEKNLRAMAEEAGIKDFYDRYYDWASGFVHGHWGAIRDSVFTVCLNPLHRFHRIPFIPRLDMPSVLSDAAKIINSMLEILNQLYPHFKMRIKHDKPNQ